MLGWALEGRALRDGGDVAKDNGAWVINKATMDWIGVLCALETIFA